MNHQFFVALNAQGIIASEVGKYPLLLDDYLTRTQELAKQTEVLISLVRSLHVITGQDARNCLPCQQIFNIATLQDARAAVEEAKAANTLAASIQRVTILTFFYLPITLAAVRLHSLHLLLELKLNIDVL